VAPPAAFRGLRFFFVAFVSAGGIDRVRRIAVDDGHPMLHASMIDDRGRELFAISSRAAQSAPRQKSTVVAPIAVLLPRGSEPADRRPPVDANSLLHRYESSVAQAATSFIRSATSPAPKRWSARTASPMFSAPMASTNESRPSNSSAHR
jgi:hypothetical protein